MQYMIIERFKPGKIKAVYERFMEKGRLLPDGVQYISSWISEDLSVCYQLMDSDTEIKIQEWVNRWVDLAAFDIIPVISSAEAKEQVLSQ